jgi:hypothetical protein
MQLRAINQQYLSLAQPDSAASFFMQPPRLLSAELPFFTSIIAGIFSSIQKKILMIDSRYNAWR